MQIRWQYQWQCHLVTWMGYIAIHIYCFRIWSRGHIAQPYSKLLQHDRKPTLRMSSCHFCHGKLAVSPQKLSHQIDAWVVLLCVVDCKAAHSEHWCLPAPHWTVGRLDTCWVVVPTLPERLTFHPLSEDSEFTTVWCLFSCEGCVHSRRLCCVSPLKLWTCTKGESDSIGTIASKTFHLTRTLDPLGPTQWTFDPTWHQTF